MTSAQLAIGAAAVVEDHALGRTSKCHMG
jgi:hypothetical protein